MTKWNGAFESLKLVAVVILDIRKGSFGLLVFTCVQILSQRRPFNLLLFGVQSNLSFSLLVFK